MTTSRNAVTRSAQPTTAPPNRVMSVNGPLPEANSTSYMAIQTNVATTIATAAASNHPNGRRAAVCAWTSAISPASWMRYAVRKMRSTAA